MIVKNNFTNVEKFLERIAETALRFAAYDVRQIARRSIKSGGKNRKSKRWRTSKPGEIPFYHSGKIKNAIDVEKVEDRYVVGPRSIPGGVKGARALEHGGTTTYRHYEEIPRPRKRKRKTVTAGRTRPKLAYPTRQQEASGDIYYKYFYSREAWENARQSAGFLALATRRKLITEEQIPLAARPTMRPALAKFAASNKMPVLVQRAARQVFK